jgi:hypothetical protein
MKCTFGFVRLNYHGNPDSNGQHTLVSQVTMFTTAAVFTLLAAVSFYHVIIVILTTSVVLFECLPW